MAKRGDYISLGGKSRRYALKSDRSQTISRRQYLKLGGIQKTESKAQTSRSLYTRSYTAYAKKHGITKAQARSDPSFRATYNIMVREMQRMNRAHKSMVKAKRSGNSGKQMEAKRRYDRIRYPGGDLAESMEDLGLRQPDASYPVGESPK